MSKASDVLDLLGKDATAEKEITSTEANSSSDVEKK